MRVIFDTNVWTYIGERGERHAFEEMEERLELTVIVPPSLLLEALRTPVPEVRASVVEAMTSRRKLRIHPLPEARLEADELVLEARRLRPSWVRRFPQSSRVRPLEAFWTRRIWQLAATDPARVAAASTPEMDQIANTINAIQHENKDTFSGTGFRPLESEPWVDLTGQTEELTDGWNGGLIMAWRSDGAGVWWHALVTVTRRAQRVPTDTSYADWAGALLDLAAIARDRSSWNRFWYHEVEAERMPRTWMRSVLPWVQLQTKLGPGNPRDAQHAAYLFDADVFVTADRRYLRGLELARRWTRTPFARGCLVPGSGSVVDAIEAALTGVDVDT